MRAKTGIRNASVLASGRLHQHISPMVSGSERVSIEERRLEDEYVEEIEDNEYLRYIFGQEFPSDGD